MISLTEAKKIATCYLQNEELQDGPAIIDEATIPFDGGWIFYFTSNRFLRTQNPNDQPVGNHPILVDSANGWIYSTRPKMGRILFTESPDPAWCIKQFRFEKEKLLRLSPREPQRWNCERMTIAFSEARCRVLAWVSGLGVGECIILDDYTQEYDVGWVFRYGVKLNFITGEIEDNPPPDDTPLLVDRNDGRIYLTGRTRPIADYIDSFRRDTGSLVCVSGL